MKIYGDFSLDQIPMQISVIPHCSRLTFLVHSMVHHFAFVFCFVSRYKHSFSIKITNFLILWKSGFRCISIFYVNFLSACRFFVASFSRKTPLKSSARCRLRLQIFELNSWTQLTAFKGNSSTAQSDLDPLQTSNDELDSIPILQQRNSTKTWPSHFIKSPRWNLTKLHQHSNIRVTKLVRPHDEIFFFLKFQFLIRWNDDNRGKHRCIWAVLRSRQHVHQKWELWEGGKVAGQSDQIVSVE